MTYLLSLLFGLSVGSFANVCIHRLPYEKSLWRPRSQCPGCKHRLRNVDNIPLVSFLLLRGRCRFCRTPISWQYPLVEASMAVLFLFHAWYFSQSLAMLWVANWLGFYVFTISIIDYRHRIIPDELTFATIGVGLLTACINPIFTGNAGARILQSMAACVGGGTLMYFLAWAGEKAFKKEALGGGDIKFIAATGTLLGWQGILGPLMLGSLTGGLVALGLLLLKQKKLGETLPFGPFLGLGAYLTCLFPNWWDLLVIHNS